MIQLVHRAGRVVHAAQPPEPILIPPPPQLADTGSQSFPFQMLLPLVGAGSSMLMMTLLRANPIFALLGAVVMVITAVGMLVSLVSRRAGQSRQRRDRRERYLDRLATTHEDATALQRQIRDQAYRTHPAPNALPQWAISPVRRWERRRSHADFLLLRIGTADLVMPSAALPTVGMPAEVDPLLMAEMRSLVRAHEVQPDLPTTINLDCAGEVSIVGPPEATRHVARVLLSQAAVHHAPEDLHLALVYPDQNAQEWDCLARLPHLRMNGVFDGPISRRRVAPTQPALEQLLREEIHEASRQAARLNRTGGRKARPTGPRLLAVVEQEVPASPLTVPDNALDPAAIGATVLYLVTDRLHEPSDPSLRLTIQQDGTVLIEDLRPVSAEPGQPEQTPPPVACRPDDLGPALAEGISRALAPYSLGAAAERQDQDETTTTLAELLGVDDPRAIDPRTAWSPRSPRDFLRVPIGSDDAGSTILLDLKESAQLGVGPHGLCVGATGSGKSELLRTLVAALASTHGPEDLSMILIDYKGGAAFAPFAPLPHVVGLMDNLADDAGLVERARASLAGEVTRRQKQLRDAGSSPDIAHYRRLRAEHPEMAPMPHLFVIIDEFGELLTASPDLVDLLLTIGRIGRSIGVHLLLSSQRIEAGKLRGLDTYLSYRICLRTFTEAESSTVIGVSDAFHLPAVPGYGYLKVDTSIFTRFRSGFVSGPIDTIDEQPAPDEIEERVPLLLPTYNGLEEESSVTIEDDVPEGHTTRTTVVDTVVSQLAQAAPVSSPVWLDPLPSRLTLSRLHSTSLRRGRSAVPVPPVPSVSVPIGIVDDPAQQRQDPWLLDLTLGGGHVSITGAPQSGRTSFLWTLATSAALCLPPSRLAFYGIDATGGGLSRLSGLPNVGGIATRGDRERMRRVVEEIVTMLDTREQVFSRHRIDSLDVLRSRHAAGQIPELASADVVLLVDGLGLLRSDFEELEDSLDDILRRGSGLGVHAVMTLSRSNELRMAQQPLVGTRLELRLNDPADSLIARKLSKTLRADVPGRVLTPDQLFAHTALPIADDTDTSHGVGTALEELAERIANGWSGERPAPVRMLPEAIDPADLPDGEEEPDLLPLGLFQDTMTPINLDLVGRDPHLLVLGDPGCGKSTVLRGVIESLVERHTPDELVIAVYDMRRTTADACPESYLGGHATSAALAEGLSASIAQELERRSAAMSAGQEPDGPRIVLVVDDYDILAAGNSNPLAPVIPYLSSARDLRLNVALTRPVAGSSQAMYDQLLQALRNTGATGLLMDGERSEGIVLAGMRAEHLRPGRGWWIRRGGRPRLAQVADYGQSPS
ncbi:type VII secretion protein EccC [Actinomyces naeslundii]|uniref:Type VII secretion protein EccCa / type VII secretion protein EccCb multi-domain protein n=2 Tax=Actinomyces naeslundii TaxID=1655 RepID=J3JK69_ACTNH|nr:type VII secretion protein EccC [Actinomyces naeslundii]EJN85099.1 type VII secretion protein EccCa / type VII secretion protein EccCb multi-domain protein [Actinomyces naeslundii str. Howell 279]OMG37220.1 type VII secretion protein EccC [Actinomyces naeslundii]QQC19903.1 type VII secretion protein EccC [Actinomyces naeslundii]